MKLSARIELLYRKHRVAYDKPLLDSYVADLQKALTAAEIDSAFANGPNVWKFMPTVAEFCDAVRLTEPKQVGCEVCQFSGYVADPARRPNGVMRCACANAHGKDVE